MLPRCAFFARKNAVKKPPVVSRGFFYCLAETTSF
jgi:hypothetical protein